MKLLIVLCLGFLPLVAFADSRAAVATWLEQTFREKGREFQVRYDGHVENDDFPCYAVIGRGPSDYELHLKMGEESQESTQFGRSHFYGSALMSEAFLGTDGRRTKLHFSHLYDQRDRLSHPSMDLNIEFDENRNPVRASGQGSNRHLRDVCVFDNLTS